MRLVAGVLALVGLGSPFVYAAAGSASGTDSAVPASYPVDSDPPKDFFDGRLLRTLKREASAVVVCHLLDLVDVFPAQNEPDIFYDATCDVSEVIRGRARKGPIHFVWQVERGTRMPPRGAELLTYLKARKRPLDAAPAVGWVVLDTGVLRYTDSLKAKIHPAKRRGR